MKAIKNIDGIVEKYWNGQTTLEEEKLLKDHFAQQTSKDSPEQALFGYFSDERSRSYSKVLEMPKAKKRFHFTSILSIAASLLVLAAAMWTFNTYSQSNSNETVIDDPEVALQITREAFALLNGKVVDRGEQAILNNIEHLDKTLIFKNL